MLTTCFEMALVRTIWKRGTSMRSMEDNLIVAPNERADRGFHPTQKPIRLLKALIELTTQKGQFVLARFAGSGSTLVAAKELMREYVGFEISKEYYDNAIERLNKIC